MFSTPLNLSYIDSPSSNLEYLFTLEENDLSYYAKGYIQCSRHVQEALVDAKSQFLNAALEKSDFAKAEKVQLLNYVKLLDSVEDTLVQKVKVLQQYWPGSEEI